MKQTLSILLILITAFTISCTSCKKDKAPEVDNPYGLPNATQTGANTFAYLIDGKPQIVENSIYLRGGAVLNDTLGVFGEAGDNNYFERLTINIKGGLQQGLIYQLNNPGIKSIRISTNKSCKGYLGSNVLNLYSTGGTMELTKLDLNNKIISGKFNCKIPVPNCDTLKITNGRFDIKYN